MQTIFLPLCLEISFPYCFPPPPLSPSPVQVLTVFLPGEKIAPGFQGWLRACLALSPVLPLASRSRFFIFKLETFQGQKITHLEDPSPCLAQSPKFEPWHHRNAMDGEEVVLWCLSFSPLSLTKKGRKKRRKEARKTKPVQGGHSVVSRICKALSSFPSTALKVK